MKRIYILILGLIASYATLAQIDGARLYWAMPKNTNILSALKIDATANASVNNLSFVNPSLNVNSSLYMLTYTRSQPIFNRTFYSTFILPAGDITADIAIDPAGPGAVSNTLYQHGFGDLMWLNTINIIGAPGLMIKDFVRLESPTLIYFQTAITIPTGKYDEDNPINMGSNQYKFKIGTPIVQRIGPWVDGKKVTLEVFPSFTYLTKNKDFQGQELDQSAMFILETHLTKDITKQAYLSLDYSYIKGGSIDFTSKQTGRVVATQEGQNAHAIGATVKYKVHDQLHLMISHLESFNSGSDNISLEGNLTKITLAFSFHDFQEKFNDYINSN